jgi:hypothetical protein
VPLVSASAASLEQRNHWLLGLAMQPLVEVQAALPVEMSLVSVLEMSELWQLPHPHIVD